jgi:hypothetical protein
MPSRSSRPAHRPVLVAQCLILLAVATGVLGAASAHAADYKMLLCAGNNGSNGFQTATNTTSAQNPSGIFDFSNYCGPAPDPAGNSAFLRIAENQSGGNAGNTAYGSISWTVPPWIAILAAGGYTREPNAFNDGWRGRFWAEGFDGSTNNILMQGSGVENGSLGGIGWGTTSTFAPHLWPFGSFGNYRRFVFELTCVRPSGCDRSNFNAVDANSFALILADVSPVELHLTNTTAPLLGGQWVRGAQTATYSWSDQGSGIRMEWINIDGARRFTIDHASECNTGSSAVNGEFARDFQPCATASGIGRSYAFDTASLPDGAHTLQACAQDYAQYQGLYGTGGASCEQTTIRTDNTPPGAPSGLEVTSANPQRYLPSFGAHWQLPPNQGSPIAKVHYNVVNAAGEVIVPEKTVPASEPSALSNIEGPAKPGDYRLRVWLEDSVGLVGPATTAQIPHDTTPPAAPQDLSVTAPSTSRAAEGFDVRWRNIADAGSPIASVHYQVLDASDTVAVPTKTLSADNVQAIQDLETPTDRGNYTLRLWLQDEEGNVGAPVTAPLAYDCVRSEVPGGLHISAGFGGAGSEVVGEGSGSTLAGNLRAIAKGIAGAPLCVFANVVTDPGREFLGIALTDAAGNYRFAIPPGPSRNLSVIYRPDQRQLSAEATLLTRVRPTFQIAHKVVHNRHLARFSGQIPGPHNEAVVVVLQVRSGRGWRAFRRYRTREGGRFSVGYRFTRTFSPTKYVMRAQVRETTGYPYLQGNSRQLALSVLPAFRRR